MRLSEVFTDTLRKMGISRIWPCTEMWKLSASVAEGRAVVCRAKNCRISMSLNGICGEEKAHACVIPTGRCDNVILDREAILNRAKKYSYPYVLVDCRYHNLHTEKELRKLKLQLKCTVGIIRKFMWRDKMVVTGKKFYEVETPFYKRTEDFLEEKKIDKVLLLDPNAEEDFLSKDSKDNYECYVIGGIVDLSGSKRGLTSKLGKELEKTGIDVVSRKFTLRGDTVGVPDRINSIAEILLRCVVDGEAVEKAILSVQSPLVARWRLRKELVKNSFRLDKALNLNFPVRAVKKQDLYKLRWLKVSENDFYIECKKLGFFVVDESFLKFCKPAK